MGYSCNKLLLRSTTFCLAYFVAKKGEKNGILGYNACVFFIYFAYACNVVAFILQLFQDV